MDRVFALCFLAWSLVRSLVDGLLGRRRGLAQFEANYAADRLPPVTSDERVLLPLLSGCIACGLCELGDRGRAHASPMELALSASRSMPDYDAGVLAIARLTEEALVAAERLCPTRVPLRQIASFVRTKAR